VITVEALHLTYRSAGGVHPALRGVGISVARGGFLALLGPSGCGKTTLLRSIAGLERPESGRITIGNVVVFDGAAGIALPAARRDLGMVFQSYAIWPHMSVLQNAAFPLRYRCPGLRRQEAESRVRDMLQLVQLDHLADRPAPMLSGGQQQRLALARALVSQPSLLLLDEPLSNLDARLREEMRFELRRITKKLSVTTIFVTHEQGEALSMADEVVVMRDGQVLQTDAPQTLYAAPHSEFVADFVGRANLLDGVLRRRANGALRVDTVLGLLECQSDAATAGDAVRVVVRPEALRLVEPAPDFPAATVIGSAFLGDVVEYELRLCVPGSGELVLRAKGDPRRLLPAGTRVGVRAEGACAVIAM